MQCQKTFLAEGRCKNNTFGASRWCRWHKIIEEFRSDLSRVARLAAQGMMFTSSIFVYGVAYCLWFYAKEGTQVWPIAAVFLCGGAAKFFADGCIAQDHPFANFALWGKLLTFGLLVEVVAGGVLGWYLLSHSAQAEQIVSSFSTIPFWISKGPPILIAAIFLEAALSTRLLMSRVLFLRRAWLNTLILLFAVSMVGAALRPLLGQEWVQSNDPKDAVPIEGFWQPYIGGAYTKVLIAVSVVGFLLAEVINKRMRSRGEAAAVFRSTVWPSFPVCYGSPFLGIIGSRFLMAWTGQTGPWVFSAVALALSCAMTAIGTRWLVRVHQGILRGQADGTLRMRERREQVLLFLRSEAKNGEAGRLNPWMAQTMYEIQTAVEYSATGELEGYQQDGDFFIISMAGASADSIFRAALSVLEGASIRTGSFAVLRYGEAGAERLVEL